MFRTFFVVPFLSSVVATSSTRDATITLPDFYFRLNELMTVNHTLIVSMATSYCHTTATPTAIDFFFAQLPLTASNLLCPVRDRKLIGQHLGNVYASGYLGGVYFRDVLENKTRTPDATVSAISKHALDFLDMLNAKFNPENAKLFEMMQLVRQAANKMSTTPIDKIGFDLLVKLVHDYMVDTALSGTDDKVINVSRTLVAPFSYIYAYQFGYLKVWDAHRPTDAFAPYLVVGDSFFDASIENFSFPTLDAYKGAIKELEAQPNAQWAKFNKTDKTILPLGYAQGEFAWDAIVKVLNISTLQKNIYETIYTLSAIFILVGDVGILSGMSGSADSLADDSRCSLIEQSIMALWAGSYFIGLVSDLPHGTMPTLQC